MIKISAQKIDDTSLILLEDADLNEMGITEKGPRIVILAAIEKMRSQQPPAPCVVPSREITRETFRIDPSFRIEILHKILDQGQVPEHTGLCSISRLACKSLEERVCAGGE